MKKLFAIALMMVLTMNGIAQEIHYDFSVINSTGYALFYRIMDEQNHWVEVTYPCKNGDNYYWGYDKPEGKLILADTIAYQGTDYILVAIGDHAFCDCTGLRGTLEFPESIQTIGAGAFKGCSNLSGNLNLPVSMKRIEDETFSGCSSFSGILRLPDSTLYVGDDAFLNCSNFTGMMRLPFSLVTIGKMAFKGCSRINSISAKMTTLPTTAANAFDEIPSWITVNVPYNTKEAYQNAPGWSRFASHTIEKSIWTGNAEPWTHGNGSEEDPYLIESAENLAWLSKTVNERVDLEIGIGYSMGGASWPVYTFQDVVAYQDTCFRLVIDVDLRKGEEVLWRAIGNTQNIDESVYNDGEINAPHYQNHHGYYYTYFSGQFDGNGHKISKVHYYASKENIGLFGIIDNAVVSNLIIDDLLARPYYYYTIGGLVARANNSTLYNCHTSGTINNSSTGGGIVGIANNCRMERCSSQTMMSGNLTGGITGIFVCDTTNNSQNGIFNCHYIGYVNDAIIAGGIVGRCKSASENRGTIYIENCFSRGKITTEFPESSQGVHYVNNTDNKFGGIVGEVTSIDTLSILNCYSNDTITSVPAEYGSAKYYAGGILAQSEGGTTLLIKNCYHVGPMSVRIKGGILAQNTNMTIVRNCFFDKTVAPDDGFGVPLESDYMKTEAFVSQINNGSSVFRMDTEPYENDGYPVFGTDGLIFVGAEWYYEIHNDDGTITYQHLQCTGDTTIHNKRPKVIVRSNTQYDKDGHTEKTYEYVYEENGVVYWWNSELEDFTVLYDFSAEIGDEWEIKVGSESIVAHVYETETEMINGIPYKSMTIGDVGNIFSGRILSTIGHTISFFPEKLMTRGKGYRVEGLRCYWLDGDLMLKIGNEDCDAVYQQYHHGVDEMETMDFVVYPNPANNVLIIETQGNTCATFRITNVMGQTLLQGLVTDETQRIDIAKLTAGMYFITVGDTIHKFIINR